MESTEEGNDTEMEVSENPKNGNSRYRSSLDAVTGALKIVVETVFERRINEGGVSCEELPLGLIAAVPTLVWVVLRVRRHGTLRDVLTEAFSTKSITTIVGTLLTSARSRWTFSDIDDDMAKMLFPHVGKWRTMFRADRFPDDPSVCLDLDSAVIFLVSELALRNCTDAVVRDVHRLSRNGPAYGVFRNILPIIECEEDLLSGFNPPHEVYLSAARYVVDCVISGDVSNMEEFLATFPPEYSSAVSAWAVTEACGSSATVIPLSGLEMLRVRAGKRFASLSRIGNGNALRNACMCSHWEVVFWLSRCAGFGRNDALYVSRDGRCPVDIVVQNQHSPWIEFFTEYGITPADIAVVNRGSLIKGAAMTGRVDVLRFLTESSLRSTLFPTKETCLSAMQCATDDTITLLFSIAKCSGVTKWDVLGTTPEFRCVGSPILGRATDELDHTAMVLSEFEIRELDFAKAQCEGLSMSNAIWSAYQEYISGNKRPLRAITSLDIWKTIWSSGIPIERIAAEWPMDRQGWPVWDCTHPVESTVVKMIYGLMTFGCNVGKEGIFFDVPR